MSGRQPASPRRSLSALQFAMIPRTQELLEAFVRDPEVFRQEIDEPLIDGRLVMSGRKDSFTGIVSTCLRFAGLWTLFIDSKCLFLLFSLLLFFFFYLSYSLCTHTHTHPLIN